jgi:LPS-assembly protein
MAGLQGNLALSGGEVINAMAGQELRLDGNNPFPVNNGGDRDISDIVGQLGYSSGVANIEALYRLDDQNYLLRRSEIRGQYNFGLASIGLDHVRINDDAVLDDRNDLTAYGGVKIYEGVNVNAFARRDILRNAMVMAGGGFSIDYDCVVLYTSLNRTFTQDRDFQPDTSITFSLGLKNLTQ